MVACKGFSRDFFLLETPIVTDNGGTDYITKNITLRHGIRLGFYNKWMSIILLITSISCFNVEKGILKCSL